MCCLNQEDNSPFFPVKSPSRLRKAWRRTELTPRGSAMVALSKKPTVGLSINDNEKVDLYGIIWNIYIWDIFNI
jgi:hypothetical protein